MHAAVARTELLAALRNIYADGEPGVTSHLRLDVQVDIATLTAYEKELLRTSSLAVHNTNTGSVVLPSRVVTEYIRSEDSHYLLIDEGGRNCELSTDHSKIALRTYSLADWPTVDHLGGSTSLWTETLVQGLRRVVHATASDSDSRETLKGVAIGDGWIVATDSYRLAAVESSDLPNEVIIVPAAAIRFLTTLSQLGPWEARLNQGRVTFSAGPVLVTTSLIQGAFPNWRAAVPEGDLVGYVQAKREDLVLALRRLTPIGAYANNKLVRIQSVSEDHLLLTSRAPDLGYQEEIIGGQTNIPEIGFSAPSLKDLAENMVGQILRLDVIDLNRAVVAREEKFIGLVTPMRL